MTMQRIQLKETDQTKAALDDALREASAMLGTAVKVDEAAATNNNKIAEQSRKLDEIKQNQDVIKAGNKSIWRAIDILNTGWWYALIHGNQTKLEDIPEVEKKPSSTKVIQAELQAQPLPDEIKKAKEAIDGDQMPLAQAAKEHELDLMLQEATRRIGAACATAQATADVIKSDNAKLPGIIQTSNEIHKDNRQIINTVKRM